MIEKFSKTLSDNRKKLISDFLENKAGDFYDQHSSLFDEYFINSFEGSHVGPLMDFPRNPYALIALGGYGRMEQAIHSDVDLLFLFSSSIPDRTEKLIQEIVYPLWDIGIEVGHSTLTVKEAVKLAASDFEVLMSILDGRFLCGMSNLFSVLMDELRRKVILSKPQKVISMVVENNRKRHEHFGDSTYLLEPNLKEGQGGLRDFHTMLWIARIKSDLKRPRDLEYAGYVSHSEFEELNNALGFIRKVRSLLHHLAGRKCDQLYLEYQAPITGLMQVERENGHEAVEVFLGQLHGQMEYLKQLHLMFLLELGFSTHKKTTRFFRKKRKTVKGLEIKRNMIGFISSRAILQSPDLLIRIFEQSAKLAVPLNADSKRIIRELLYLVDVKLQTSKSFIKVFERILLTPAPEFNALNEMMNTGFLTRVIPEFEGIVNRIQYDEYHLYPAHKHSLRTVQTTKKFAEQANNEEYHLYNSLYTELKDKTRLLWACLLHDIGKVENKKGHSERGADIARHILERFKFKQEKIEDITFLVREHLFLVKTATRRDVNDEETIIYCARKIKDPERLKMLFLLSVSDSMSTGPKAWNEWTATLLRDLFLKTMNIISKGEFASSEAVEIVEQKKQALLSYSPENKKYLEYMSPRYMLYVPVEDIPNHICLVEKLGSSKFTWEIRQENEEDAETRVVTICAENRPGLFSRIAGVFTLNSINIIDAQIYTWRNNVALDIFRVTPPPDLIFEDEKWEAVKQDLQGILADQLDISELLSKKAACERTEKIYTFQRPTRVNLDNESSSFFTIIEVFSYDFLGLLFKITDTLFKCELDIHVAKIATKIDQVVDVFYIRDFNGDKVTQPDRLNFIKSRIEKVLSDEC